MWKAYIILLKPAQIENDLDKINKYLLCSSDVDPALRYGRPSVPRIQEPETGNNLHKNAENLK